MSPIRPPHSSAFRPVFIGGSSRSGTTLLGAMLGVGAQHLTVPEAEFKWQLWSAGVVEDGRVLQNQARRHLAQDPRFALWGVDVPSEAERLPYAQVIDRLVAAYGVRVGKPDVRVWFDHTPGNIRFGQTLYEHFPRAKFIHIVRDGRAVAASVIPLDWGPNTATEAAHHWATQVCAGLALEGCLGPDVVRRVRYEDVVGNPAAAMRELCDFVDMPFREEMVTSRDYSVQRWTGPQHRLVASAPDPARITGWRQALRPGQIRDFERTTGELLSYLGYDTELGITAPPPGRWESLRDTSWGAARRLVVNKVRFKMRSRQLSPDAADQADAGVPGSAA